MKHLKTIFAAAVLLALSLFAAHDVAAQDITGMELYDSLKKQSPCIVEYRSVAKDSSGLPVYRQSGTLTIQDNCWRIFSDKLRIYSDGLSMWVYDIDSDEVTISQSEMVPFLGKSTVRKQKNGTYKAVYKSADGITVEVDILKTVPAEGRFSLSYFVLDESGLSDDVLITDLR